MRKVINHPKDFVDETFAEKSIGLIDGGAVVGQMIFESILTIK